MAIEFLRFSKHIHLNVKMSKIRLYILLGMMFCHLPLLAELYSFPGEWESSSGVKKFADTPLGAVYKFDGCALHTILPTLYPLHKKNCDCSYCRKLEQPSPMKGGLLQFNFLKNRQRNSRYVAIDFKIRAFPALDSNKTHDFRFRLVRSAKTKIDSDYDDLNGLMELDEPPIPKIFQTRYVKSPATLSQGSVYELVPYQPEFGPLSVRVLFDTDSGYVSVYYNGELISHEWSEQPIPEPIEIRTFGIITTNRGSHKRHREEYLEFSNPVVRMASTKEELFREAPPGGFSPYPYASYLGMIKKEKPERMARRVRQHKNPDLQYAFALRWLYGQDPDPKEALELLERAAGEKHVLALYQLGICYWRGYGVERDWKKALRYFEESADYTYSPAALLHWIVHWQSEHRSLLMTKDLRREYDECGNRFLLHLGSNSVAFPATLSVLSPKYLIDPNTVCSTRGRSPETQEQFYIDHMIARGYFPGKYELLKLHFYGFKTPYEISESRAQTWLNDCAVDKMFLLRLFDLARRGKLKREEFTPLRELQYADEPLWHILKTLCGNGEMLKSKLICDLSKDHQAVLRKNPWLEGMFLLLRQAVIGNGMITDFDSGLFLRAFEKIKEGEKSAPVAQYWLGMCYSKGDLPETERRRGELYCNQQAVKYFQAAAQGGMRKAEYMLLELEAQEKQVNVDKFLERLEPFCELDYAPAWMLRGRVLRNGSRHEEAKAAFRKAADLGEHYGLHELALYAENEQRPGDAKQLWGEYIQADLHCRKYDRFDPYWPDDYEESGKWMDYSLVPEKPDVSLQESEKPEEEEKPHPLFGKKKKDTEPKPRKTKVLNP